MILPVDKDRYMAEHEKSHIVVLGGGFGGLTFCQHFHHPAARVTLVGRTVLKRDFRPLSRRIFAACANSLPAPNVPLPFALRPLLLAIGRWLLAIRNPNPQKANFAEVCFPRIPHIPRSLPLALVCVLAS